MAELIKDLSQASGHGLTVPAFVESNPDIACLGLEFVLDQPPGHSAVALVIQCGAEVPGFGG